MRKRAKKQGTNVRQEQIAKAALDVVAKEGMKGLSMARVAENVGLVPSGLYRHFSGKEQILDAVLNFIRKRLLKNVELVRGETDDPVERLHRLLQRHVDLILRTPAIAQIVFSAEIFAGPSRRKQKLRSVIADYLHEVQAILRDGQDQNVIRRDVPPATLSMMFLGLIQPGILLHHLSGGEYDFPQHAERAWSVCCDAICRRKKKTGKG
jgi:AcrR family transcriptional regulator